MKYLSISQLSEVTGIDRRTCKDRIETLTPIVKGRSHLYHAREAIPLIINFGLEDNKDEYHRQIRNEELRHEKAKADKIQLQVEKLRGELVPIEDVARVVETEYAAVRAALLAISSKVSGELASMDSVIEIKKLLDGHINEVLAELSADQDDQLSQPSGSDSVDPGEDADE
jgi:phage terminase Nu1 subunit (DNA packaging protein)